ncbi:MAG: hypothetical protein M0P47_08085 [Bacteroidales bacterium]|nr:hypothetical protein [Bacteroidales bacterium]
MKLFAKINSSTMIIGVIMIFSFINVCQAFSQDQPKTVGEKTAKLKIIKGKNGKTTMLDTTLVSESINQEDLIEQFAKIGLNLKEMGDDLNENEFNISIVMPDSSMTDSIQKIIKKIIIHRPECKPMRIRHGCCGNLDICREMACENAEGKVCQRMMQMKGRGQTLSDVIGEIPMSRVKSYSIKDIKGGKRIVIELNDGQLLEDF